MKIVSLVAENLKRIRAVEIEPDGPTVVIAGRNGQGKTSVLDAIWFALGGAPATRETPRPIRDGADEATVTLDLGDFTVTRKWRGDRSTLTVLSKDGAKYTSPQAFLDERLGALSFDPLAFANSSAQAQRSTLLELVSLPFDLDALAAERAAVYERRTDIGRQERQAAAELASFPDLSDAPAEELSAASVLDEQAEYSALVDERRAIERSIADWKATLSDLGEVVASLGRRLEEAQRRHRAAQEGLAGAEAAAARIPDPEPVDFAARLAEIERINDRVRLARQRSAVADRHADLKGAYEELTAELAAIDERKATALAEAAMPIDGLGFDEHGVTFGGVPFAQCSGAERLRVSLAMAMALNPAIRVVRITDGSLLDSDNFALIQEMAAANDFQVWVERVGDGDKIGFVIEDGEVVPPAAAALADALEAVAADEDFAGVADAIDEGRP